MRGKFSAKHRSGQGYSLLAVSGIIDEDNELVRMQKYLTEPIIILDVAEVTRINSCGVRDWVNWLGDVCQNARHTILIRCSPAVIAQANMVTNFCASASIYSFKAPYFCDECDKASERLLTVDQFGEHSAPRAPEFLCEICGSPLEFDDFEESYFAFLSGLPRQHPPEVMRVLAEVSPDVGRRIQELNDASLGSGVRQMPIAEPVIEDRDFPATSPPTIDLPPAPIETPAVEPTVITRRDAVAPPPTQSSGPPLLMYALIGVAALVAMALLVLVFTL